MTERFDALVIGAGQAGPALAVRCAKQGLRTAIVERHRVGGTCINNGCVPTKTLIASARAAQVARQAGAFGVRIDAPIGIDMARVKARKDEIVDESRRSLREWLDGTRNLTIVEGHAVFTGAHRVRVGAIELEAPRIFINVGGRASIPDMPGLADVAYLNNARIMHVDQVPEHLLIVGGSYIGLEFAQMYRRFGSRVTVVETAPRLIGREDTDVSEAVESILRAEDIEIRLGATCLALERGDDGQVAMAVACSEGPPRLEGSHVLLATGRVPNTHDLGLQAAGVATDTRGYIVVDEGLSTNVEGIWALGDCNGRGAFTHTSWNDYEIVAANLFDGAARKVGERIPAYALFIDPPLGRVGMTHAQVQASGRPALAAKMPMSRVGRAREMGETLGFMKIVVAADTHEILGAAILGVHGDEVIHTVLEVMTARQPYTAFARGVRIHPTVSELLPTLLEALAPL
ncbi:MAG: FAD-containing oxidoreductase [Proteobacteria bacterium]|nr:FAD-containing oxidoreductase [Burkholderiales bacterium]